MTWSPGHWDISSHLYHEDVECVSHSMLEVYRDSPRRHFHQFVARNLEREPTPALVFGGMLHCLLFEAEAFNSRYAISPVVDRRTKAGKATWAHFCEHLRGRTPVSVDDIDQARLMAKAARDDAVAGHWARAGGLLERSYRWVDHETGVPCRMRVDKQIGGIVLDLKSCRDPSPAAFGRDVRNLGYHRQAAWYLDGFSALEIPVSAFLFLAISKDPPYDVALHELDTRYLEIGRTENRMDLLSLASRRASGDWRASWARDINKLCAAPWQVATSGG